MFDLKIEEFANLRHRLLVLINRVIMVLVQHMFKHVHIGYQYFAEPPFLVKVLAVVTGLEVFSRSGK